MRKLVQAGRMSTEPATYPGYRFPAEVIHHALWLYHLFSLSLRDIELILAERGVVVSYKSIRRWCLRFGTEFAGHRQLAGVKATRLTDRQQDQR
jgi:transposase-like protein